MTHTEKCNPVAERAALRRQEWEAQASPGFWSKPRFDLIDLILMVLGVGGISVLLTIVAFH